MSNFIDAENVIINLIDSHVISGEGVIYLCRELYKKEQQTKKERQGIFLTALIY